MQKSETLSEQQTTELTPQEKEYVQEVKEEFERDKWADRRNFCVEKLISLVFGLVSLPIAVITHKRS